MDILLLRQQLANMLSMTPRTMMPVQAVNLCGSSLYPNEQSQTTMFAPFAKQVR
jgi:hypothetical protein